MLKKKFFQFQKKTNDIFCNKSKIIDNGEGNDISIDEGFYYSLKINGNNNKVIITSRKPLSSEPRNLIINISGNNNTIIIKECRTANLNIDIGNYKGVDNVELEIGEHLVCAQASILCYQNNVPVKIGKNCLFSNSIVFRSGELPHKIYDLKTNESLDYSDGIFIGNHVWIGEHCYIMKHAKISDNSIVGAMSIVTKAFTEENVVIAGNPAKICKKGVYWKEG